MSAHRHQHLSLWLLIFSMLGACTIPGMARVCPTRELTPEDKAGVLDRLQLIASTEELLAAVEELDRCGKLNEMDPYISQNASGNIQLRLAVMLVQTIGRGSTTPSALQLLLFKSRELPASDMDILTTWALRRLTEQSGDEGEAGLALAKDTIPSLTESRVAANAATVVEAGPWLQPGSQPFWLYIGNDAHRAIAEFYRRAHPTDFVRLNHTPLASILAQFADMGIGPPTNKSLTAVGALALRPDITNLSTMEIYEIKPAGAEALAQTVLNRYIAEFAAAGVTVRPGTSGAPGTEGIIPAPEGHFIFYSPAPGIISYQYRRGSYRHAAVPVRAPVPVPASAPASEEDSGWWEAMEKATGLTGAALVVYLIISEGSRVAVPPRNFVPVP